MEADRMKKVVSFSGGRTSAYLCHLMKEKFGDDVDFIFMDTGAEHPMTYRFVRDVVKFWDLPLTVLRVKINPELGKGNDYEVFTPADIQTAKMPAYKPFIDMMEKYGTPYIGGAFCTDRMKTQPFTKYCNDTYGRGNYETWLGIRDDEPKRLNRNIKNRKYLADISDFDKEDVIDWWKEQPFDLLLDGEHLGNCTFCIKKSVNKIALAARDEVGAAKQMGYYINSKKTRVVESRTSPSNVMFRGRNSLESIIAKFSDFGRDEIKNTIQSMKKVESGSCSESCEAFICEANQVDMFKDF